MNWMPALRRARLTLLNRSKPMESCMICGCAAEPYEYVCDAEVCQLQALDGQAMLANAPVEPPAALRRIRFTAAAEERGSIYGDYGACV